MLSRQVKKTHPINNNKEAELQPFIDILDCPNIILLGEPGAGKSYLFENASQYENTKCLTARNFKIYANTYAEKVVYIDALDEKRSRNDDINSIEEIIVKLVEIKPSKLRLSCRAADWLSETDLELFKPYFEENGGYCVVSLQELTDKEIDKILVDKGIGDPLDFRDKAYEKSLDSMLTNPQTLVMLADIAIKNGQLPNSKRELYDRATQILLTEHNDNHQRKPLAHYPLEQLTEVAGLACAALLIADVEGISLKPSENAYLSLPYPNQDNPNPDIALAALTKRAFVMHNQTQELVTYSHRTIAEYLAACFLVKQIRGGLPLGRVRSLLEVEGYPATELRGLYAWLTHLLPEYAAQLVTADPYGALVYGDVSCLSLASKKALLNALVVLADKDPWFRRDDWTSAPLGALSTPEMAEDFKTILSVQPPQFHLRSIVLNAIAHGKHQQPELEEILLQIFCDENAFYAERENAFSCLINAIPNGEALVVKATKEQLQNTEDGLRLKEFVISSIYEGNFNRDDIVKFITDYINNHNRTHSIGGLWGLGKKLPPEELPDILDSIVKINFDENSHYNSDGLGEFLYEVLNIILQKTNDIDVNKLWLWLSTIHKFHSDYPSSILHDKDEIKDWLINHESYVLDMFKVTLREGDFTNSSFRVWLFYTDFQEATQFVLTDVQIIKSAFSIIEEKESLNQKEIDIFELALNLTIRTNPANLDLFTLLINYSAIRPELSKIVDFLCFCSLDNDWRGKQRVKEIERKKKSQETQQQNRKAFEHDIELIRNAQHFGWLEWLASLYFARFSDVDKSQIPRERFAQLLGEENLEFALEGLRAVINRSDLPSPLEVVNLYIENKYREWWYAILAGITESYYRQPNLDFYSESTLKAALAINLLYPSFYSHEKNTSRQFIPAWQLALFQQKPELVQAVYLEIINVLVKTQKNFVQGVREICENPYLTNTRPRIILKLLRDYPNIAHQELSTLLFNAVFFSEIKIELIQLIETTLASEIELTLEQRALWLAAVFFVDFENFKTQIENYTNEYLFQLIDFFEKASWIEDKKLSHEISATQSIYLLKMIGQRISNVEHKIVNGAYRSSPNEKAAEFVKAQINKLSTFTNTEAINALTKLINEPKLESYRNYLKHAAANQAALHRKESFHQPNWQQTIEALKNGKPANIADLYALTIDHLKDICNQIRCSNTNIYKDFWNNIYDKEKKQRVITPRLENDSRNRLIELLKPKFLPLGISVEPEGHMVNDNRADIVLLNAAKQKLPIEVKRDYHVDLWTACENQLDRLYTRDPQACDYGIYLVFWFGDKRPEKIKNPPKPLTKPTTAPELKQALESLIKPEDKHRLAVVVIDVTCP